MHKKPSRGGVVVPSLVCLLLVVPLPTVAQDNKAQAGKLFEEARALYDRGMYLDALKRYRSARELYPSFKIDLNIGTTLFKMGRRTEGAGYLERFLANSAKAPPEIIEAAKKKLEVVRATLARVEVNAIQRDVALKVDGKTIGLTPRELPVYLEPGEHAFEAAKDGFAPFSATMKLTAGQRRVWDILLKAPAGDVTPPTTTGPSTDKPSTDKPVRETTPGGRAHGEPAISGHPVQPRPESRNWRTAGWFAVGLGAASMISGGVLGALASQKAAELETGYKARSLTYPDATSEMDVGEGLETGAIVTLAVGGALVAAGGVMLLVDALGHRETQRRAWVAPGVLPGGGGVAVGASF